MIKRFALAGAMVSAVMLAALAATPLHTYNNSVGQEQETIGVHCINNTTGEPESCGGAGGGGDATAANQVSGNTKLDTLHTDNTTLLGRYPAALGGTTSANSFPVVLSSDGPFSTQTGGVTETAPATDTASSGLNGRLQRIAQRLTSMIALLPTSLGQKTMANSLGVTLASDQTALAIAGISGSAADNAAIVGNPVPIGGKYELTPGTLDDGDVGYARLGSRGALHVESWMPGTAQSTSSAADNADGVVASSTINKYVNISRNTVFDGTNWNRQRSDTSGNATSVSVAATSGGASVSSTIIPNNTTAVVVKASAGQVYKVRVTNNSATIAYLKLYDATSATAGVGTPKDRIMVPGNASGAGIVDTIDIGAAYATGITFILTTGIADNDTGAPAANTYLATVYYK